MGEISRRELLAAGAAAGAAAWLFKGRAYAQDAKVPIAVSSGNGLRIQNRLQLLGGMT